ncbi:hypothetical protein BKA56DRAFT_567894 [Ilyonectria sp. MPI-CAGE-AT-0026]|nr:hypothetical protein BKA56DRAFT_567894 [Ilyonectria sp. MPI-CAGE-AT-0026]
MGWAPPGNRGVPTRKGTESGEGEAGNNVRGNETKANPSPPVTLKTTGTVLQVLRWICTSCLPRR